MKDNEALELLFSSALGGEPPPVRLELDPAYRFPPHRWPDPRRPTASANDGRPTDPAVLAEIEQLVAEFATRYRAANGEAPPWGPGYSEEQIAAAEERIGARLPEDLRAFYRLIHDDGHETGVAGRYHPVPLEQVVEWHGQVDEDTFNGQNWLFAANPVVFGMHPPDRVRRSSGNDRWVPFATDNAMNFGVVDLDPAPGGQYGQIFAYGRDATRYVAPSITHLMRAVRTGPAGPGGGEPPGHELRADRSLPEVVAAERDPGRVQHVLITGIPEVDLRDLAGLPALRSIEVSAHPAKAGHADLARPAGAPVEFLDVTAASFDPGRLAGAPDLAYLTLAGNEKPVRIDGLSAVPGLLRLRLSGAAVADVAAIATFPALRALTLNGAQWTALLASGWDPRGLAGAELAGPRTEAEEVAFERALGH